MATTPAPTFRVPITPATVEVPDDFETPVYRPANARRAGRSVRTSTPSTPWCSVADAAAVLGLQPVSLRRAIERSAVRSSDGTIEVSIDGVRARKFGRVWRV